VKSPAIVSLNSLSHLFESFSWSSNSKYLLYSELYNDQIFILKFDSSSIKGKSFLTLDLSEYIIKSSSLEDTKFEPFCFKKKRMCGNISDFSLDQNGERLVISFENSNLIALMRCDFESHKTYNPVSPVGFIRTTSEEKVCHLNFWKGSKSIF
jgi:hypothetical protein